MSQQQLDDAIQKYYSDDFDEDARIQTRSVGGRVELERTRRLISRALPARSRVLDVGGVTGVHSRWLAEEGYDVTLIDPVPAQVERAARAGSFEAVVGDARSLPAADGSVDAVLLLGPLYHLVSRADRLQALREAHRVLRGGGLVFAQGIGRDGALDRLADSSPHLLAIARR